MLHKLENLHLEQNIVSGSVRPPKESENITHYLKIEAINYLPVKESKNRPLFDNLTPLLNKKI